MRHLHLFFNETATTELYTLSLHDALPILPPDAHARARKELTDKPTPEFRFPLERIGTPASARSEEHTSELQSLTNLVCRLLLEKKNQNHRGSHYHAVIQQLHLDSRILSRL